jgi:hypothetical protein
VGAVGGNWFGTDVGRIRAGMSLGRVVGAMLLGFIVSVTFAGNGTGLFVAVSEGMVEGSYLGTDVGRI